MVTYQAYTLLLLLTAPAIYGNPVINATSNPDASHDPHVPREPRVEQPLHAVPPHGAALDKAAQPVMPRDTNVGHIPCTTDDNCTATVMGGDAICHGNLCSCRTGTKPSPISQKCLSVSSLGGGCEEDWQCTDQLGPTVSCKNYQCTCLPDAALVGTKCYKQKLLSDKCEADGECLGGRGTLCTDHYCVCKSGTLPNAANDKCLKIAEKFEDPCEEDIQCTESMGSGAVCNKAKCVCQNGYHHKNHECMKNLILGQTCGAGIDGDCFLYQDQGINHVECVESKCQCKDDRIASSDNQKCLAEGQKDDGSGGGADSVQPVLLTSVTILLARFLLS